MLLTALTSTRKERLEANHVVHLQAALPVLLIGSGVWTRHVRPAVLPVVPGAVRRSGSGRREDRGEPLAASAGTSGEPDPGDPRGLAGLGGGRVEGRAERRVGDEWRSDPGAAGLWGALWSWRGGRTG